MSGEQYSKLSQNLTAKIDKSVKKRNGIFFTPPSTVSENIKYLQSFMRAPETILEPSCGSCEYIRKLRVVYPESDITGVELNKNIFE